MSNYANLKSEIQSVIKTNGDNEITGQLLQNKLLAMITTLGYGYQFMGIANPNTVPGTPDAKVFYIAYTPGTYTNFNGISVTGLCVLKCATGWVKEDIPISGGGTDFAVEPTDLTFVSGTPNKLKFADRAYNSTTPDGLGYKILRKDLTFAQQVSDTNTIYEVRYEFDLSGASKTIPSGVILRFNGGCIKNGTIVGDDTRIQYNGTIFDNVTISGTWIVPEIRSDMFKSLSNNGLKNLFALQNDSIRNHILVESGNYVVGFGQDFGEAALVVGENTDCEINGTISLDDNARTADMLAYGYYLFRVRTNSRLYGTGELVGDITANGANTQYGHCIIIWGGDTDIEISGVKISDFAGDGIYISSEDCSVFIHDVEITNWNRNGISVVYANIVKVNNLYAHDGGSRSPMAIIDVEPNANNSVNLVEIDGVIADNVGVGFQVLGDYGKVHCVSIKNANVTGCKNMVLSCYGQYGCDFFDIEDCDFSQFPSNHTYEQGDVITMLIYKNAYFRNVNVDVTDITTKTSFGLRFQGDRNVFEQCNFVGGRLFTYHLKNTSFKECLFDGSSPFWPTATGIKNVEISNSKFVTSSAEFRMDDSIIKDSIFEITGFPGSYGAVKLNSTTLKATFVLQNNRFVVTANGESDSTKYILGAGADNSILYGNIFDNSGGEAYGGIICGAEKVQIIGNKFLNFAGSARKVYITSDTCMYFDTVFPNVGTTANRPTMQNEYYNATVRGARYFDTTLGRPSWFTGSKWVDGNGYKPMANHGADTDRPTPDAADIGFTYFDTTLGKMIVWNGTAWVNVDGTPLS